jgi:glucose/arabinose dehydrogenase
MIKRSLTLALILLFFISACTPAPLTPTQPDSGLPTMTETQPPAETPSPQPTGTAAETKPTSEVPLTPTQPPFIPEAALVQIADGLTAPVALAAPDDDTGRLFIVDQIGLIYIIDEEDQQLPDPFLDLSDRLVNLNPGYDERGLLGLAFHPDYAQNQRFFVYYSAPLRSGGPAGWDHTSRLSTFRASTEDPNRADPESENIILQVDQPQGNHNAGAIAFGPDGYLYVPLGDGGGAHDTGVGHAADWYEENDGGNGQDVAENMLGSILRLDVDQGDPYSIPADNPNISEAYPEIWAYGFRNPYRMAFDPGGNHELFLGDAGQELWEEVSIIRAGGNYGWNVKEGAHCFSTADPGNPEAITDCPAKDPDGNPLIDPIIEFMNTKHPDGGLGLVIIGGVVYRGETLSGWDGHYLFGQWSRSSQKPQGTLFVASRPLNGGDGLWNFAPITITNHPNGELGEYLLAFGQDPAGEVYILTSTATGPSGSTGKVFRLVRPED